MQNTEIHPFVTPPSKRNFPLAFVWRCMLSVSASLAVCSFVADGAPPLPLTRSFHNTKLLSHFPFPSDGGNLENFSHKK